MLVGPVNGLIVDISTSVSNLITLVEICFCVAGLLLHSLSGTDLGLDFRGRDRVVACVKLVEEVVVAF